MDKKIGPIFGEFISTGKVSKRRIMSMRENSRDLRSYIIPIFIVGILFVIITRLFFLQVVQGSYFRMLSDGNRVKTVVIHAPRGIIFDRNGTPLVYNVPGFRETVNGRQSLLVKKKL